MKRTMWFLDWTTRACCYIGALVLAFDAIYYGFHDLDYWKATVSATCVLALLHFATFVKQEPSQ